MKHSIIWVSLAMTLVTTGYANPRHSLAGPPAADRQQLQTVRRGKATIQSTPERLTLTWALNAAVEMSPALAATGDEIQARQAAVRQAALLPNPALFTEIEEFGGSGDFSGTDAMASTIGLSQEFPLGGKIGKRVGAARADTLIANLEHQVKLVEIRALVEQRFFAVFTLQERLKLQMEQYKLMQQAHNVVIKRVKIGDTSPLDLARSQVELATANIEIDQTRKELDSSRFALAESWGADTPDFSAVSARYQTDPDFTEQDLIEDLAHSSAWHLLEKKSVQANAVLDLAKAQSIPDLELEGGIQRFNESDDHAFFLGLTIPLPLFDRNQGTIAEARAMTRKTRHQQEAGFLALHTELQEAWRQLLSTSQAVRSLETEVLPAAENAYQSISKAYKAGEVDILGLLDTQRTWVETRMTHLDLLHDQENSRIEIQRLIGDGAAGFATSPANNNSYN